MIPQAKIFVINLFALNIILQEKFLFGGNFGKMKKI